MSISAFALKRSRHSPGSRQAYDTAKRAQQATNRQSLHVLPSEHAGVNAVMDQDATKDEEDWQGRPANRDADLLRRGKLHCKARRTA
mmetsp:Transcript_77268/g.213741  ORF Transcript_77268/g.213741 Transcript_77268/m.213741 type:complete len:87 (+) Transcript_77268:1041-1301(+)